MLKNVLVCIIAYLLGSIPWALVIGKVFYGKDIRTEGSGNLGASNAGRVLGKKAAISVTLLDAFKVVLAMAIARAIAPQMIIYAGLCTCIGHCFPVFAQFHGGKAVASSYGLLLGICLFLNGHWFWGFLFPILCFFAILYLCQMVSVSSLSSLLIEVITSFILKQDLSISVSLLLLWLFVVYRHRGNLERIRNGTERKVTWIGRKK